MNQFVDQVMQNTLIDEEKFSENEQKMFEQENKELEQLLNEEYQQAIKAEKTTREVVELLNTFTELVMTQDVTISNIFDNIDTSVDNIKMGNIELQKAKKYGKTSRKMFISLILALTFSLLFLDYYK